MWELPQNLIGLGLSFIYKYDELIPYGNKQIRYCKKFPGGISLGNYVFVGTKKKDVIKHEYGHTIQSLILGPLYLIVIGIPSTLWGFLPNLHKKRKDDQISYFSFFTEGWANRLGEKVTGERSMGNLVID